MTNIATAACELLERGESFILATIVSHHGSTPRTAGTRMIVAADGTITGTIGGGILEAKVMETAAGMVAGQRSVLLPFDLSQRDAAATMDMICGGTAEVLLDRINPDKVTVEVFQAWRQAFAGTERCCFLTVIRTEGDGFKDISYCLVKENSTLLGTFPLSTSHLEAVTAHAPRLTHLGVINFDGAKVLIEPVLQAKTACLFGGGHVAQPTAHMAAIVGFRVIVSDDRAEFANPERFPDAHDIRVMERFDDAFSNLNVNKDTFIVIFTRGHVHDRTVLAQALATDAGYIGMIGSRRKRDIIFDALRKQGIPEVDIQRVHSPIGIDIGAETPQEIAVSIVAEMIRVRSRMG
jgi:xanthine dehydrogenase accessory factor